MMIPWGITKAHAENNRIFMDFMRRYSWARFSVPNPEKAPWHWKVIVRGEGPYEAVINIWPHLAKAQREGHKSVQGWEKIRMLMSIAIDENGYDESPQVTE